MMYSKYYSVLVLLFLSSLQTNTEVFVYSAEPDEMGHYELSPQDLQSVSLLLMFD